MGIQEIVDKLNKLYWTNPQDYMEYLQRIKAAGYKVYRNSKGKHKVEGGFMDMFNQILGGTFK